MTERAESHDVSTLLAKYGPTWMLGVGFDDTDLNQCRYK